MRNEMLDGTTDDRMLRGEINVVESMIGYWRDETTEKIWWFSDQIRERSGS